MNLRQVAAKVFAKARPDVRTDMNRAASTPDQLIAADERALQLKELADRRSADQEESRSKAAQEHQQPVLTPYGMAQVKSKSQIERIAHKEVDAKHRAAEAAINAKSDEQLIADAKDRQERLDRAADRQKSPQTTPDRPDFVNLMPIDPAELEEKWRSPPEEHGQPAGQDESNEYFRPVTPDEEQQLAEMEEARRLSHEAEQAAGLDHDAGHELGV